MSKQQKLRDIDEQKSLLVSKGDLQRSTLLMLTSPVFKLFQAAELGLFAVRVGKRVTRYLKH